MVAAIERGEVRDDAEPVEAAEWVARSLISLATVPGNTLDPDDDAAVLRYVRRYVLAGLSLAAPR